LEYSKPKEEILMGKNKPITKTDKLVGMAAKELALMADSVRLPGTDKPQKIARNLYKTAHKLTGVPQKHMVSRDEEEIL
jgi:hypothetical protein